MQIPIINGQLTVEFHFTFLSVNQVFINVDKHKIVSVKFDETCTNFRF